jgi:hypothetical protein
VGAYLSRSCVQLELKLPGVDDNFQVLMTERLFRCFSLVQVVAGREGEEKNFKATGVKRR